MFEQRLADERHSARARAVVTCYWRNVSCYPETMRRLTNAKGATGWYRNGSRRFSTAIAFNTRAWTDVRKTQWNIGLFFIYLFSHVCVLVYNNNSNKILTIVLYHPCPGQLLDLFFFIFFPFENLRSFFPMVFVRQIAVG